jgi:hypothetical protein
MHCANPGEFRFQFHQIIKPVDQFADFGFASHQFEGGFLLNFFRSHGVNDSASVVHPERSLMAQGKTSEHPYVRLINVLQKYVGEIAQV